jgi:hypothetical protein
VRAFRVGLPDAGVSIAWAWGESVAEYVAAGQQVVPPVPECPGCDQRLGRWVAIGAGCGIRSISVASALDPHVVGRADRVMRCCRIFCSFDAWTTSATIGQVLALRATADGELRLLARRFNLPRETLRGWGGSPSRTYAHAAGGRGGGRDWTRRCATGPAAEAGGGVRGAGADAASCASAVRGAARRRRMAVLESHQRRQGSGDQHEYALAAAVEPELHGAIPFGATSEVRMAADPSIDAVRAVALFRYKLTAEAANPRLGLGGARAARPRTGQPTRRAARWPASQVRA